MVSWRWPYNIRKGVAKSPGRRASPYTEKREELENRFFSPSSWGGMDRIERLAAGVKSGGWFFPLV
jgi:hypothetical protein